MASFLHVPNLMTMTLALTMTCSYHYDFVFYYPFDDIPASDGHMAFGWPFYLMNVRSTTMSFTVYFDLSDDVDITLFTMTFTGDLGLLVDLDLSNDRDLPVHCARGVCNLPFKIDSIVEHDLTHVNDIIMQEFVTFVLKLALLLVMTSLSNDHDLFVQESVTWLSYLAVAAVILFVVGFATGPGSIPWFFVTELFAQSGRPIATSIAVAVNWSANFLVGLGFSPIQVSAKDNARQHV
jgi:hypothetical protein